MSQEVLRLKPEQVIELIKRGEIGIIPDLKELRGPNSTLKLIALAEDYVRRYEGELLKYDSYHGDHEKALEFDMSWAVKNLQQWATSIDEKIIQAATNTPPGNKSSLERMVDEMVQSGQISNSVDLFSFKKPTAPTGVILPFNHLRSHHWIAIKALFDIDTSGISTEYYFNILHGAEYDPVRFYTVHEYMLQLIAEAVGKKGYKIEDATVPEQANQPINAYSIPSDLEGVSIIFSTFNDHHATIPALNGAGHPNIWNATLKFEPSFLSSVRPLNENEYQKYVPNIVARTPGR